MKRSTFYISWALILGSLTTVVGYQKIQAERPANYRQSGCDWIYSKAQQNALAADMLYSGNLGSFDCTDNHSVNNCTNVKAEASKMWSVLYLACAEHEKH